MIATYEKFMSVKTEQIYQIYLNIASLKTSKLSNIFI